MPSTTGLVLSSTFICISSGWALWQLVLCLLQPSLLPSPLTTPTGIQFTAVANLKAAAAARATRAQAAALAITLILMTRPWAPLPQLLLVLLLFNCKHQFLSSFLYKANQAFHQSSLLHLYHHRCCCNSPTSQERRSCQGYQGQRHSG